MAAWIVPCLAILALLRRFVRLPDFLFRKLVHTLYFCSALFLVAYTHGWGFALADCLVILCVWFPVLLWAGKHSWYQNFFVEKRPGEILRTFLMLYGLLAVLILVCGLTDRSLSCVGAAVLLWGVGDAAAAIAGTLWGKKKLSIGPNKGLKSYAGSAAMLAVTLLIAVLLNLWGELPLLPLLISAVLATLAEAFTPGEWDTLVVTLVAFLPLFFRS